MLKYTSMKHFKKKTLALMLASFVTVAGSLAEENYKNSIMGMAFEQSENGAINLILETKKPSTYTPKLVQREKNTYIIMLPEINNNASSPDITNFSGNIENVNIRTMPYTNSSKGYTKITIKTFDNTLLTTSCKLFIPTETPKQIAYNVQNNYHQKKLYNGVQDFSKSTDTYKDYSYNSKPRAGMKQVRQEMNVTVQNDNYADIAQEDAELLQEEENSINSTTPEPTPQATNYTDKAESQKSLLLLWIALIALISVFIYLKAKDKINDVVGENLQIDIDSKDSTKKQKEITKNKIKSTIKKLDEKYTKNTYQKPKTEETSPVIINTESEWKKEDTINIVDLDELFQKQTNLNTSKKTSSESEIDLDDFLSGLSVSNSEEEIEEKIREENEKANKLNEELYEKILNNNKLNFSKDDIECINKLTNTEISDETINNIEKYAISNPITGDKSSVREKLLEKFILDYTISQNVTFTSDDIKILNDLINVEIDKDFITDLRTNPNKNIQTKESSKDSLKQKAPKPTEILTLHISDKLPDLSEALKKQGNRPIKSEAKPEVIYYSEGYDVETLTLDFDLPDLSKEINNKSAYIHKESEAYNVVDTSYQIETLKIDTDLPDLKDILENPDKYKEPEKEDVVIDMDKILKNLDNVQLKPFYDGTEEFEVLNHFDDDDDFNQNKVEEFNFRDNLIAENLNPIQEENIQTSYAEGTENAKKSASVKESVGSERFKSMRENLEARKEKTKLKKERNNDKSKDLIDRINNSRKLRAEKSTNKTEKEKQAQKKPSKDTSSNSVIKYVINGITYNIINSAKINDNIGFHLAKKGDLYVLLSYKNDEIEVIKEYKDLEVKSIKIRKDRNHKDDEQRFLMRLGNENFVVNVVDDKIIKVINL